jgi:uncharacterized protein
VRIVVEDLPDEGAVRLQGSTELDLRGYEGAEDLVLTDPVDYDLRVSRLGSTVDIEGQISCSVEAPCSRCAQTLRIPIERHFDAVFVTSDTGETDRAVELDERDLDLDYYEGGVIDGLRLLAEQIFLEFPMKILCSEDCKGLCAQCGANLNDTECDCEPEPDPRWANLKSLRDQL